QMKTFFTNVLNIIWKEDAKNLLKSEKIKTSKDIKNFISNMPHIEEATEEEQAFFKRIQQESERITEWKDSVQNFLNSRPEETLLEISDQGSSDEPNYESLKAQLQELNDKVTHLQTWYNNDLSTYTDLADENKALQKILRMVNWTAQALEL